MAELADSMHPRDNPRFKNLTRDTATALSQHRCLIELSEHLLTKEHYNYVMLGNFTSDRIEKEFGKLRQGSSGAYFITAQGIFKKIGIKLTQQYLNYNDTNLLSSVPAGHKCSKCNYTPSPEICELIEDLTSLELEEILPVDTIMGLVYIAGYVIRKDERDEDSTVLSEKYGDFVRSLNRGGLSLPGDSVCQWVIFCFMVFHKVASESCRRYPFKIIAFNI